MVSYTGKNQYNVIVGTMKFCLLYQIFCYISVVYKQFISLGPEKTVCYIRYLVISDLLILSFLCIISFE